jgi:hypothetical protein
MPFSFIARLFNSPPELVGNFIIIFPNPHLLAGKPRSWVSPVLSWQARDNVAFPLFSPYLTQMLNNIFTINVN